LIADNLMYEKVSENLKKRTAESP